MSKLTEFWWEENDGYLDVRGAFFPVKSWDENHELFVSMSFDLSTGFASISYQQRDGRGGEHGEDCQLTCGLSQEQFLAYAKQLLNRWQFDELHIRISRQVGPEEDC